MVTSKSLSDHEEKVKKDNIQEHIFFRDTVLGKLSVIAKAKADLIAKKLIQMEHVNGNILLPMFHVASKIMEEMSTPSQDALVVKVLGKNFGFNSMQSKLENIWKLTGRLEIMDVGSGYYMAKFDSSGGKNKVINGGPWMIFDHYLKVHQWLNDCHLIEVTIVHSKFTWRGPQREGKDSIFRKLDRFLCNVD